MAPRPNCPRFFLPLRFFLVNKVAFLRRIVAIGILPTFFSKRVNFVELFVTFDYILVLILKNLVDLIIIDSIRAKVQRN